MEFNVRYKFLIGTNYLLGVWATAVRAWALTVVRYLIKYVLYE